MSNISFVFLAMEFQEKFLRKFVTNLIDSITNFLKVHDLHYLKTFLNTFCIFNWHLTQMIIQNCLEKYLFSHFLNFNWIIVAISLLPKRNRYYIAYMTCGKNQSYLIKVHHCKVFFFANCLFSWVNSKKLNCTSELVEPPVLYTVAL